MKANRRDLRREALISAAGLLIGSLVAMAQPAAAQTPPGDPPTDAQEGLGPGLREVPFCSTERGDCAATGAGDRSNGAPCVCAFEDADGARREVAGRIFTIFLHGGRGHGGRHRPR